MTYETTQPERSAVDALPGLVALDFGTNWCGWCRAGEPVIEAGLKEYPQARHIKVEDGPGRPLGRSFRIKLWPTVVFLQDGVEIGRVTRPDNPQEVREALRALNESDDAAGAPGA